MWWFEPEDRRHRAFAWLQDVSDLQLLRCAVSANPRGCHSHSLGPRLHLRALEAFEGSAGERRAWLILMQREAFRAWLLEGNRTQSAVTTRLSRIRKLEDNLEAIGAPQASLDDAYDADRMSGLMEHLGAMRSAAEKGDRRFAILSDTSRPYQYLSSLRSVVSHYRQFRDGEPATRKEGDWPQLEIMREAFLERMPDFTDFQQTSGDYWFTEREYKDRILAAVAERQAAEADDAALGRAVYTLLCPNNGPLLRWQTRDAIEKHAPQLIEAFDGTLGLLARAPASDSRDGISGTFEIARAAEALELLRRQGAAALTPGEIRSIAHSVRAAAFPFETCFTKVVKGDALARRLTGKPIFDRTPFDPNEILGWQRLLMRIFAVMRDEWGWKPRDLLDVQGFAWVVLDQAFDVDVDDEPAAQPILLFDRDGQPFAPVLIKPSGGGESAYQISLGGNTRENTEDVTDLVEVARALLVDGRLVRMAPPAGRAANLIGYGKQKLVGYRIAKSIADALGIPSEGGILPSGGSALGGSTETKGKQQGVVLANPQNVILYGPPGTGKTFATARHAVALIDGDDWLDEASRPNAEVRARYQELVAAKQIDFVTFHQSYAYEDFVEGLRPTIGDAEMNGPTGSSERSAPGGFELKPVPGVFHRISTRAERARLAAGRPVARAGSAMELGRRRVFKMSIGRAGQEDYIFDDAVHHGYAAIGWGMDEDWSDPKYRDYKQLFERVNELKPGTSGNSGDIAQIWCFREMDIGDVIVVSQGNSFVRAIGVVASDYYFEPEGEPYRQRRKVDWRIVPDEPIPVSEIYGTSFTQISCYQLKPDKLNRPALERLLSESQTPTTESGDETTAVAPIVPPNQFVLIVDEINRANISKVFGELITLIEPDKRLGQDNALTVTLPYSGSSFGVPDNLHILGTMNTADRSIALLDTALRRRFEFRELMPEPAQLPEMLDGVPLRSLLATLNERIEFLFDREHQIGHGFFMRCRARNDIEDVMRRKVIPLLAEYFYEDWSKIAMVLGDLEGELFLEKLPLPPPPGVDEGDMDVSRARWSVRRVFAAGAYAGFT